MNIIDAHLQLLDFDLVSIANLKQQLADAVTHRTRQNLLAILGGLYQCDTWGPIPNGIACHKHGECRDQEPYSYCSSHLFTNGYAVALITSLPQAAGYPEQFS